MTIDVNDKVQKCGAILHLRRKNVNKTNSDSVLNNALQ